MRDRLALGCVVVAAALAGLCFAPVFGFTALLPSVAVVAVTTFAAAVLAGAVAEWRPLIVMAAGLLGVVEVVLFPTTVFGIPTGQTLAALAAGVTDSWQLTLQSTWPAQPDAALLLFVPLLVLVASVFGMEVVLRLGKPVLALGPSFLVVVVSQFFGALSGGGAIAAALGYVAVAAALFVVIRSSDEHLSVPALLPAPAVVVALVAVAGVFISLPAPVYSFKQDQLVPLSARVPSPLDDISYRRAHPDAPVFSVRPACEGCVPDRWPIVVLDRFDGVNWAPGSRYRRLGTELPPPLLDVSMQRRDAEISVREPGGRWLPSQTWPATVTGAAPLVEESQGSLLTESPSTGAADYRLSWWEPEVGGLEGAAIDPYVAAAREGVGTPPQGVAELATEATHGLRSSLVAALQLERFLRERYRLVADTGVPGGHSWPQLRRFLLETKEGTSEQFASAYVVLARMLGIPARLVVGYRTPEAGPGGEYVVHNDDVLVWPEVAVDGVGWLPLDPADAATRGGGGGKDNGLVAATREAREKLPPPPDLKDPPVAAQPGSDASSSGSDRPFPFGVVLIVVLALGFAWLAGVPLAKWVRAYRRRRRPGGGAVVGAWLEARDRLREHRVPFTAGMTPMEMGYAASVAGLPSTMDGMRVLATAVDVALWSGREPAEQVRLEAWAAVRAVRRGLASRGLVARLRAAIDPRTLVVR